MEPILWLPIVLTILLAIAAGVFLYKRSKRARARQQVEQQYADDFWAESIRR